MWQDEKIGQLSRDARLLFVALVTLADDEGRFRALSSLVLGHAYPYDDDAPRRLAGWMRDLERAGLIHMYEADGVRYGVLPGWSKHQRINRPNPSILPDPPLNGHRRITEPEVNAA